MSEYLQPNPPISGFMADEELNILHEWASQHNSIVEIGSWLGRSTHALLSACKGPVFAVDHFKGSPKELNGPHHLAAIADISVLFYDNVGRFPNLSILKMDSAEASKYFADKSVDMVFIDGDHETESVVKDIQMWLPKCKKLLCGHDAFDDRIRKALEMTMLQHKIITTSHGMWRAEVQ